MFTKTDYDRLHQLVFRDGYPGYKPTVTEIPNGDGKADAGKRYAHVAPKYVLAGDPHGPELLGFYYRAHQIAVRAAAEAGIAPRYMPDVRYGALRVLEYPPGTLSNTHKDFDLFTLLLYRNQPDRFVAHEYVRRAHGVLAEVRRHNPDAHLGELGEVLGYGEATPHEVLPSTSAQHSIVYFALPDHDVYVDHDNTTVRDWLNERMARSRTAFKAYE